MKRFTHPLLPFLIVLLITGCSEKPTEPENSTGPENPKPTLSVSWTFNEDEDPEHVSMLWSYITVDVDYWNDELGDLLIDVKVYAIEDSTYRKRRIYSGEWDFVPHRCYVFYQYHGNYEYFEILYSSYDYTEVSIRQITEETYFKYELYLYGVTHWDWPHERVLYDTKIDSCRPPSN